MKNNMHDRPLWFVFKMKQAQMRELEMYISPLLGIAESTPTSPEPKRYKIPEHLRRKKKK